MNERIRELIEQAEDPEHGFVIPEKLAELIVRECAEKCVYVVDRQEILAHFGVE